MSRTARRIFDHPAGSLPKQRKTRDVVSLQFAFLLIVAAVVWAPIRSASGQQKNGDPVISSPAIKPDLLTEAESQQVKSAVDKGLAFLSRQPQKDGSFHKNNTGEPGISALCVLAFLSRGHLPGQGPYGDQLNTTVEFLLSSQKPDGLLSRVRGDTPSHYNHAICSLVLTELYGMSPSTDEARFRKVIEKSIEYTSQRHPQPKRFADEQGSWRYERKRGTGDGDLSITSWSVMSLRSAKNSGFEVDVKLIEEATAYIKRLYDPTWKTIRYEIRPEGQHGRSRGMAGAGVLSLSLAGEHHSELARIAAEYILKNPFDQYEHAIVGEKYPSYGAFYCSQAMFQMGDQYWSEFYPRLVKTLLTAQREDGSWFVKQSWEAQFGEVYSTALTVLALTPPYQMLPIFQR